MTPHHSSSNIILISINETRCEKSSPLTSSLTAYPNSKFSAAAGEDLTESVNFPTSSNDAPPETQFKKKTNSWMKTFNMEVLILGYALLILLLCWTWTTFTLPGHNSTIYNVPQLEQPTTIAATYWDFNTDLQPARTYIVVWTGTSFQQQASTHQNLNRCCLTSKVLQRLYAYLVARPSC